MLHKFRRIAANPLCMISLAASLMLFSCQDRGEMSIANQFDGKDIFKGIFFKRGPVADRLPSLKTFISMKDILDPNDPKFQQVIAVQDLLIDNIENASAGFFEQLRSSVKTSDHLIIREAIIKAGDELVASIKRMSGMSEHELNITIEQLMAKHEFKDKTGQITKESVKQAIQNMSAQNEQAQAAAEVEEPCLDLVLVILIFLVLAVTEVFAVIDVVSVIVAVTLVEVEVDVDVVARSGNKSGSTLFFDQLVNEVAMNLNQ